MPNYKEMYLKLLHASEKGITILLEAQRECENIYVSCPEPELKVVPLPQKKKKSMEDE